MKKRLFLLALMIMLFVFALAISASAANRSFSSYEVVSNGEKITVYAICDDIGNGRVRIDETVYTEPPIDTEGTYATLDWSTVTEIDFTNSKIYQYTNNTYVERTHGTGNNGTTKNLYKGWSSASTFATVKVVKLQSIVSTGGCFRDWTGLETVYFGSTLTNVADNMFYGSSVANLVFVENSSIKKFYNNAFYNCDNIVSVTLPTGMTDIGSNVFYDCDKLESVVWPSDFHMIGGGMFNSCDKLKFDIPSHITYIGGSAFQKCPLITSVVVPKGVTYIGSDCWRESANITSIVFEEGCLVENIYAHTFHGTGITEITLPNNVKYLKQNVFNSCSKLVKINFGASFINFNLDGNASSSVNPSSNLQFIVLPDTFTADAVRNSIFGGDTATTNELVNRHYELVVFYTGGYDAAAAIVAKGATGGTDGALLNGFFGSMTLISASEYAEAVENGTLEEGVKGTPKRYLVYDYNKCEAFYNGNHIENLAEGQVDTNLCVLTQCKNCTLKNFYVGNDSTHIFDDGVIAYANGFASAGTFTVSCQNAGCVCNTNPDVTAVPAIYTYLGFAVKEDGTSLTLGYTFDKDAYESYIANNAENVVSFGFVAYATYEDDYCTPLSVNEGVVSPANPAKTIFASMGVNFAACDFVIRGFDETTQNLGIAMCAYTYDGSDVKYLCKNTDGVYGAYDVAYATTISKEA